jgi:hypothetical protein
MRIKSGTLAAMGAAAGCIAAGFAEREKILSLPAGATAQVSPASF